MGKRKRRNVKPHIIKSVKIIMKRNVIQNIEKKLLKRKNKSVILNTERNASQAMVMVRHVKIFQRKNAIMKPSPIQATNQNKFVIKKRSKNALTSQSKCHITSISILVFGQVRGQPMTIPGANHIY